MGNLHVLCSCDCIENTPENTCMCMCICLKMYLLVTVNHGPSCLQRFMAEGEGSDANPGYAIYGTDRHSKANKMFIIWLSFRQTKTGRWYRIDRAALKNYNFVIEKSRLKRITIKLQFDGVFLLLR